MIPRLVTFDCAETIVAVNWRVGAFVGDCMEFMGYPVGSDLTARYERMYETRLPEFLRVNLTRDPNLAADFWRQLGADWLAEIDRPAHLIEPLLAAADHLGFGPESILFRPYADVLPCLQRLRAQGIATAIVSNWDISLHRVIQMFGFRPYFDLVVASLEEGVEKPDPRLFHIALDRLGFRPEETLHVGDNPVDDGVGARAAGIRFVAIDRVVAVAPTISTLDTLEESPVWTA